MCHATLTFSDLTFRPAFYPEYKQHTFQEQTTIIVPYRKTAALTDHPSEVYYELNDNVASLKQRVQYLERFAWESTDLLSETNIKVRRQNADIMRLEFQNENRLADIEINRLETSHRHAQETLSLRREIKLLERECEENGDYRHHLESTRDSLAIRCFQLECTMNSRVQDLRTEERDTRIHRWCFAYSGTSLQRVPTSKFSDLGLSRVRGTECNCRKLVFFEANGANSWTKTQVAAIVNACNSDTDIKDHIALNGNVYILDLHCPHLSSIVLNIFNDQINKNPNFWIWEISPNLPDVSLEPPPHMRENIIANLLAELDKTTAPKSTGERFDDGIIFLDSREHPRKTCSRFCLAYQGSKMDDTIFTALHFTSVKGTFHDHQQLVLITIDSNYKISTTNPGRIIQKYNLLTSQPRKVINPSFKTFGREFNMAAVDDASIQKNNISNHILNDQDANSELFWSWTAQKRAEKRTRDD
jgi:hypothetical protein